MCGRFTLRTPMETIASLFNGLQMPPVVPRYNVAPTQQVLCVRQNRDGANEAVELRWGLVPSWSKDLKMGARMINARGETVATKPSFRAAFKKRRCLVLADGFFEWQKVGSIKQPYYITRNDDQPFCMAGLWEFWKSTEGEPVETCTIITTSANETMQTLHDRMPVILKPDDYDFWIDNQFPGIEKLETLLVPCADDQLVTRPVSTVVNKPANDTPECIEAIELN